MPALPEKPVRIISLVPSLTEYLYALGLEEEVCGVTRFCIHPPHWRKTKTRVGGTKSLHLDKIRALHPDWVLANKEENVKEQIETIQTFCRVLITDIQTVAEALQSLEEIAGITHCEEEGTKITAAIRTSISGMIRPVKPIRVLYLIWQNPWMAAGQNTFIHDMMMHAGWYNVVESERYPVLSEQDIVYLKPDIIFLSSEPFPFSDKHQLAMTIQFPGIRIELIDGELFSWYGSRLLHSFPYISTLNESLR
ncbi:MAG TPA: helical backbone metal receptor [Chitinophagaceae bacterium]|nr:helical backbone metal receptor [Chitinophagaceae bacterium]